MAGVYSVVASVEALPEPTVVVGLVGMGILALIIAWLYRKRLK